MDDATVLDWTDLHQVGEDVNVAPCRSKQHRDGEATVDILQMLPHWLLPADHMTTLVQLE